MVGELFLDISKGFFCYQKCNYLNQYSTQHLKLHLQQLGSKVTTEEKKISEQWLQDGLENLEINSSFQSAFRQFWLSDSNSVIQVFIWKTICALFLLLPSFYFRKSFCSMIKASLVEGLLYLIPRWGITHLDFICLYKLCVFPVLHVHTHRYLCL